MRLGDVFGRNVSSPIHLELLIALVYGKFVVVATTIIISSQVHNVTKTYTSPQPLPSRPSL